MAIQGQIRQVTDALGKLADKVAALDEELDDDTASPAYKTAIRARIKARLQQIDTALQAIIAGL